jgi:hypothetical protein
MGTAVFISYARADAEDFVRRLHQDLTKHDISVWWDREAMESRGRTFLQELRDAIEAADRVIAVIGNQAVHSSYVKVEWEHSLLFCKGVLPILRQGDYDLVPPDLAKLHCIDFRNERPYDEALSELLDKLAQPVPPLGSFRTAVPALPPHFDPRREELESLAATVLADVRRPVVVSSASQTSALQGMGGVGKSVLAAALARSAETRRAFGDGVIWLTLGREPNLLQALRLVGLAFDDDLNNYTSPEAAASCLSRLLADKVCLIVLDDLWNVAHLAPFRDALGPRCRLLFTSRDAGLVAAAGAVECQLTVLSREASLRLLAQWCETEPQSLPSQAVEIADECGDLPLAIAMVGAMLRGREGRWENVLHKLRSADLDKIARQFPNYPYPNLFRAIEVSVEALEDKVCQRYLDFAVFPESYPLPESALRTLWSSEGLDEYDTQDLLDILLDRALIQRDAQGSFTLHALQFDFIRKQTADLPALHRHLLSVYRSRAHGVDWQDIEDDGYIHNRLTWHLEMAGMSEDIHALLAAETHDRQCAWWVARETRAHTAEFSFDVARAWRLADEALAKSDNKSDRSLILHRQTLYALIDSSLANLAANLPCELLVAALQEGVITAPQALTYARGWVAALIALLPHLPDAERGRALAEAQSVASRISEPRLRIGAFTLVAPHLPEPEQHTLLLEALHLAKGSDQRRHWPDDDDYLREAALEILAPNLPDALFPMALEVAGRIWGDDYVKQKAIAHLAPYCPQTLADELIGLARGVKNETHRATALIACMKYLPAAKHPSILEEAIQAAFKFAGVSSEPSECLSALVRHLPPELLPTALNAALALRGTEDHRAEALAAISPALGPEQQQQLIATAFGFENQHARAWALCGLAPDLVDGERSRIMTEALSAARAHLEGYELAAVLAVLAPYIPAVELPATLAAARAISDPDACVSALLALYDAPLEARADGLLHEALNASRQIEDTGSRLQALSAIATRQSPEQAMETWREILTVAGDLGPYFNDEELRTLYHQLPDALIPEALQGLGASHNLRFRHSALAELSTRLSPELLRLAIVIARGIWDTKSRVDALTVLLPHVPTVEFHARVQAVLALANEIRDAEPRAEALAKLAVHLPPLEREDVCRKVLETIRDLKRLTVPEQALTALAPALPDAWLAEAMEITRKFPASPARVRTVMALADRLGPEDQLAALRAEVQGAQTVAYKPAHIEILAQILDYSPESFIMQVIDAAPDPGTARDFTSMESFLIKAVPRLNEPDRSEIVKKAWSTAEWAEYPYHLDGSYFVRWMCSLAPYLSTELLNDTLNTARQIHKPAERAQALIRVSACFAAPEAVALLDEAVSAGDTITDATTRTVLLSELAARLTPERRRELLEQARQLANASQRVSVLTNLAPHLPETDGVSTLRDAIASLPQIAEENERADALRRLTPFLPSELVSQALKAATAISNSEKRAKTIEALATRLPESEQVEALREGLLAALRITSRPATSISLKEFATGIVPADRLIPVWIELLHTAASQTRSGAVGDVANLALLMSQVAGPRAADYVFTAIGTVGRWWP